MGATSNERKLRNTSAAVISEITMERPRMRAPNSHISVRIGPSPKSTSTTTFCSLGETSSTRRIVSLERLKVATASTISSKKPASRRS